MKKYFIILLLFSLSCKETPNYNPFDNQFNVSAKKLIKDKCDTINAGCGYYDLFENKSNKHKLRTFYQFFTYQFSEVLAKGFIYKIDSFKIRGSYSIDKKFQDSIINLPIDKKAFNRELKRFNYEILTKKFNRIQIINRLKKDTINLKIERLYTSKNQFITRGIYYYRDVKQLNKNQ